MTEIRKSRSTPLQPWPQDYGSSRRGEVEETQKLLLLWSEKTKVLNITRRFFMKGVSLLVILFFIFIWGVYRQNWDGKAVLWLVGFFHFPVGMMDGKTLSMKEYLVFRNALRNFFQKESSSEFPEPVELQRKALNQVVENALLRSLLKQYNIPSNKEELFQKKEILFEETNFKKESLKMWYNLEEDEFVEYFISPLLMKELLLEKFGEEEFMELQKKYKEENRPIFFVHQILE